MAINVARGLPSVGELRTCGIIGRMSDASALARLPRQSVAPRARHALETDR
jgi:hypothetical protein